MRNVFVVAWDVLREAFARKVILGLFGTIGLLLFVLVFALNVEVVDGALAAGRLFGKDLPTDIMAIEAFVSNIFTAFAYVVFYLGLLFGIVVTSGIATDMLAPGRVEFLLALPLRRAEVLLGTYLGVLAIAVLGTTFAVGGTSAVLFVKTEYVTTAPLYGALMAILAFAAIYAVMLLGTVLVRNSVVAVAVGIGVYFLGIVASTREKIVNYLDDGIGQTLIDFMLRLLPPLTDLARFGAQMAEPDGPGTGGSMGMFVSVAAFGAAALMFAIFWFQGRDF